MKHKFVEFIPNEIEEDTLYISIEYDVAKHKCACGCGADIVTSLSPARYKLTYDGESVSLYPSIGNWTHPCKSHYFITNNKVVWAGSFNQNQINQVIKNDKETVKAYAEKNKKVPWVISWLNRFFKR